ncbi:plasmid pRiA4b ORF-3 family protein [Lelliottia wanjuensis]|uniref:plasmid pRiA4b ORF-3 family protein n=1 Tax=Lelliottia wanjuensis TaxID=3050585 RepID=UPI0025512CBE|nr:plasmid pRiA4b ORF-3 family protein [Lelliottia sp. V104_15]MDK9606806.1 plasmid pRiA4b ORF-3 family protein [Lelliottia sp. V104_15]
MHRFYLLNITLNDITPSVWRKFVVPADISLDRLHDVIQIVMGWDDSHLHQFAFKKQVFTEFPDSTNDENESFTRLNELLKKKKNSLIYTYDFGDNWEHVVTLEDSNFKPEDPSEYFQCIDGENNCPPEDCGGSYQYQRMIDALKDPQNNKEDYEEFTEILGIKDDESLNDFNEFTRFFDPDVVTGALMLYSRWSRDRMLTLIDENDERFA